MSPLPARPEPRPGRDPGGRPAPRAGRDRGPGDLQLALLPPDESLVLSATRLDVWRSCRRRYLFQYVQRLPARTTEPLWIGRLVHRVLERLVALPPAERREEAALALLDRLWPEEADRRSAFPSPEREQAARQRARAMLAAWVRRERARLGPDSRLVGLELPLSLRLGDGLAFTGRIDRLEWREGGLELVDYKTGRPRSAPALRRDLQAVAYAWLVESVWGRPVERVTFWFLAVDRLVTFPVDREAASALPDRLRAEGRAIREERLYPARPGPACRWCDYLALCPEGQQAARRLASRQAGGSAGAAPSQAARSSDSGR
ncbi:MAG: PD-(D/E)XK nuclease family protein [Bacillota bacterium]|nr:PD-(D/E)XK nuclease family protein [Bacillota bacterium]MDI3316981.1 PD-(D/E)XK nuclease family protein [Bacillota bacterium]